MLSQVQLQQLRKQLLEERESLESRLAHSNSYGLKQQMNESLGELSLYDNHPADIGDELFDRSKDLALREADSLTLERIDKALQRIQHGTYGICTTCGQDIPLERLQAEPWANRCVTCQERLDAETREHNRPVEELYLYPGYGRTSLDERDQTGFDGEDAWQEVERYNERYDYENNYSDVLLDDDEGIVEDSDRITNEQYLEQLPERPKYRLTVDEYTLPESETDS
jgi:DnaK suppressor protein